MSWADRLREAAYTSPSGVRFSFEYEDVGRNFERKGAALEFPDADGTYVQDLGPTGRRYPMRFILWGEDYDQQATAFENALAERGTGKLEHPAYGTIQTVPLGRVARRDDLKTAGNQAIIEVTLWETLEQIYPIGQSDRGASVLSSVDNFNAASAAQFAKVNPTEDPKARSWLESALVASKTGLETVANSQADVSKQFRTLFNSVNDNTTALIDDPLSLATQTTLFLQSPARAVAASVQSRLVAFNALLSTLVGAPDNTSPTSAQDLYAQDLYAMTYVTGGILSVVNTEFQTRTGAIEAAEEVLNQFETAVTWRDEQYLAYAERGETDTGEAYQALQDATALTVGFLVEISFTLAQERSIVLDRNRSIVDLAAELYQDAPDEHLDFLVNSNKLSGDEIIELPVGREIVYYV